MSIIELRFHRTTETRRLDLRKLFFDILKAAVLSFAVFGMTVQFVARGYRVHGICMDPNIRGGERFLGSKLVYALRKPARGDIVVFTSPENKSSIYVKRVVGLPGERVEIRSGVVYINGRALTEPYLRHVPHGSYTAGVVKPDRLFVMGDYRDRSNDSRYWGQLPVSDVQAKAWVRYWPIGRASVLN